MYKRSKRNQRIMEKKIVAVIIILIISYSVIGAILENLKK